MEKIELNTKHITLRYILFAVCCIVAIFAIWYAVSSMLNTEKGWQKVTVNSTDDMSISGDLTFYYNLGVNGKAPRTELRELSSLYTEQCVRAWKLLSTVEQYDGVGSLATINAHPNEEVTVEPELYAVFSELKAENALSILYLAPCHDLLKSTASAGSDEEAKLTDPVYSEDAKEMFEETVKLASDGESISLELLGDSKVKLNVSDAYKKAMNAEEGHVYVDFGWMRNAVAVEIITGAIIAKGYSNGMLSSDDGFIQIFDDSETAFSLSMFGRVKDRAVISAQLSYSGHRSMILFSSLPFLESDELRMYSYQNGDVRTVYVGLDGEITCAAESLAVYEEKSSLVTLAARYIDLFMGEEIPTSGVAELRKGNAQLIWTKNAHVYYTEESAVLQNVYETEGIAFETVYVK